MLQGTRPRPPTMRRTTSTRGMTVDMQASSLEAVSDSDSQHPQLGIKDPNPMGTDPKSLSHAINNSGAKGYCEYDERLVRYPSTTSHHQQNLTSHSACAIRTAHFLLTCGLCKRRLAPGRDIYMYRGDTAFCSLECREQQMKQDERKEKRKVVSNKEDHHASPPTATSQDPAKG